MAEYWEAELCGAGTVAELDNDEANLHAAVYCLEERLFSTMLLDPTGTWCRVHWRVLG